jgi:peptidoglycan/xylan/chitin deacetylase (PgdA/CDA1 family)
VFRSPAFIWRDVHAGVEAIREITGVTPRWFRPPYGLRWLGLRGALARYDLHGIQWTVLAGDWKWPAERIVRYVARRVSNGSILCLHDGRDLAVDPDIRSTLDAVARLVPALLEQGWQFKTVGELLARCGTSAARHQSAA